MNLHDLVVRGPEPDLVFEAIRTVEFELSRPPADLLAQTDAEGNEYVLYRVLVRLHHHPLGFVLVDLAKDPVSAEELNARIRDELGPAIRAHLRADGMAEDSDDISPLQPADGCHFSLLPTGPSPLASVIVCTFGRPRQLRAALRALHNLSYENFEVIVVDNDPSDPTTIELISSEFADSPLLRYVAEPRRGLSVARNSGIAVARGDIIAFTDDDIVVDQEWLSALVGGFDEAGDIVCVTGLTLAADLESPAQQIFERYGAFNKGYETLTFDREVNPSNTLLYPYTAGVFGGGGNCAVRVRSVDGTFEFDSRLGPGTQAFGAEDLDLFLKFIMSGKKIRYVPVAVAWHEHRRSYEDLRWQMFTYGAGSTALLTKWLLTDHRVALHFVRLVPKIVRLLRHQSSEANVEAVPSDLRRLERLGYLYGPMAYLRSAFVRRRGRSATLESVASSTPSDDFGTLRKRGQLLVVSPHLDDAVFSCSGIVKGVHKSHVHTLFAGDAPRDRPLSQWDRDCGFVEGAEVMEQRRNEEREALQRLHAIFTWEPHLQEGYRLGELDQGAILAGLAKSIEAVRPSVVLFPLGLQHSDHIAVASAMWKIIDEQLYPQVAWYVYADKPYADRRPSLVRSRLLELKSEGHRINEVKLPRDLRRGDLRAIRSYASQLRGLQISAVRMVLPRQRVWRVVPSSDAGHDD